MKIKKKCLFSWKIIVLKQIVSIFAFIAIILLIILKKLINISEEVYNIKGLVCADIDHTLLVPCKDAIGIWKIYNNGDRIYLSTEQFSEEANKNKENKDFYYDYSEFNDPKKVRDSITKGFPLLNNLKVVSDYLNKGYDFCFLTARGCEDVIQDTLFEFLEKYDITENLYDKFKKGLSVAVNDVKYIKIYDNLNDAERKSKVLTDLCKLYDDVIFIDDNDQNIKHAKGLNLKNLNIVKAYEQSATEDRAGVIVILKNTNYILACQAYGKSANAPYCDLPKGHININENAITCALRELKEETGLIVEQHQLVHIGKFKYMKNYLTLYCTEIDFNLKDLYCESMFENNRGNLVPEMVGYELVDVNQLTVDSPFYNGINAILTDIFS